MNHNQANYHFVTGKLAEQVVRSIVEQVAQQNAFDYTIQVLPITVAALMTPTWLLRHVQIPPQADSLFVPGYLSESVDQLSQELAIPVVAGPRDIRDLPMFFGGERGRGEDYGAHDIQIIAEINHAPKLPVKELIEEAQRLQQAGADIIDVGCSPGHTWNDVGVAVAALKAEGHRVSIDSFNPHEVALACKHGAELVLSVNSGNRDAALDWGVEVVVIPDETSDKKSFYQTAEFLANHDVAMRLDPILSPIGCGFAESLQRYIECRRDYPEVQIMMGIGNITELTDADSAGINVLLLGLCQELGIGSVLTTQVINWARTSVHECHLARQLVHFACRANSPPKHLEPGLVLLRDERLNEFSMEVLAQLAESIRDKNIRIFVADGMIHAVSAGIHARGPDPFQVMQQLLDSEVGASIDASHAFYLGFEMSKALTARQLHKQYTQDQPLNWGFLSEPEHFHRIR